MNPAVALAIALAFAIGSIPFGLIVGRVFFKTDIRSAGSGNIGAANALRTFGKKAGAAVLLLDACKGALAVVAAAAFAPRAVVPLAGLAAILGHCYSPWLRMRGGKGVATFLGVALVLSWPSGAIFVALWLAIVLPTGFSSLGSMLGTAAACATIVATRGADGPAVLAFALGSAFTIVWKHRENIGRLRRGTENRLALIKR